MALSISSVKIVAVIVREMNFMRRDVGQVTSACLSRLGAIGLGFVRRPHDAPGSRLRVGGDEVRVAELPFLRPGAV